ncbi:MAG: HAD family hydrolase [Thermomicrobium sp.]
MSRKHAGILFDLDGVLINSEEAHYEATRRAFQELDLPELPEQLYRTVMLGRPDREAIATVLVTLAVPLGWLEHVLQRKALIYRDLLTSGMVKLLPDGIATVEAALTAGYPVAIVTGSLAEEARWALQAAGLIERIAVVVSAEDVEHGKPHPEPYLVGCQRLSVAPQRSIAVEDSPAGITAGRAAGLRVLAVARYPLPAWVQADRVVTKLSWEALATLLDARA